MLFGWLFLYIRNKYGLREDWMFRIMLDNMLYKILNMRFCVWVKIGLLCEYV